MQLSTGVSLRRVGARPEERYVDADADQAESVHEFLEWDDVAIRFTPGRR